MQLPPGGAGSQMGIRSQALGLLTQSASRHALRWGPASRPWSQPREGRAEFGGLVASGFLLENGGVGVEGWRRST